MLMRSPAVRWSTSLGSALFVLALLGTARSLVAQDPYIKIREPREWQEGKPFVVQPGRSVRITGVAWHPAGIRQILINETPVTIEPDPPLTNFEYVLTAGNQPRTITIVVVPLNSQRFETKFAMAPPESARPATQPAANQPSPVVRAPRSSGFKKRGWIYLAGAIGGGILGAMTTSSTAEVCETTNGLQDCFNRTTTEANYRAAGFGLAGAAIVAGILDYTLSSRSSRVAAASGRDSDARATIHLSTARVSGDGRVALGFVRVRF